MANNRLYLVDTETDRQILIAKSWGDGWILWNGEDGIGMRLQDFFDGALDFEAQVGKKPSNLVIRTEDEME